MILQRCLASQWMLPWVFRSYNRTVISGWVLLYGSWNLVCFSVILISTWLWQMLNMQVQTELKHRVLSIQRSIRDIWIRRICWCVGFFWQVGHLARKWMTYLAVFAWSLEILSQDQLFQLQFLMRIVPARLVLSHFREG